ncbi:MAG TPA: hypothetical protein VNZ45_15270, partial [Bacteroidia bacterium]|nr:hypothetical protein [Bacteroidia bacterium]
MANGYAKYSAFGSGGSGGSGVSSLNSLTGTLNLVAGTGITVTPSGSNITIAATGAGSGTVTSVSVVSANGLAGTVANPTTTPAITLSSTVVGIVKGNGTVLSAAVAGTDYVIPSGSITGTASNITASSNSTLTTLSALSLPLSQTTGVATIAQGGTDNGSLPVTAGGVIYTDGTKFQNVGVGTSGQILQSNAGSPPTWVNISGSSAFVYYASSIVNTTSLNVSSTSFTTVSNSPAFTITPTITGKYKVYSAIPLDPGGTSNEAAARIFNTSGSASLLQESQGIAASNAGSDSISSAYTQSVYTLVAGTTYQFDIQIKSSTGANISVDGGICSFYMFAEGIGLAQPTNGFDFFTSNQINTLSSSITSTSFTTFSNSPAFSVTPNFSGNYKVY